jgi:hypothetical protein
MARTNLNPALRVLSGNLAGYVFRKQADGSTRVAKIPLRNPDRQIPAPQAAQMERFKQASAYCQRLRGDPAIVALYQHVQARRGPMSRLRPLILGDILKAPEITAIDVSQYHGVVGDIVTVHAKDNVAVARVTVTIRDQANAQGIETLDYVPDPEQLAETVEWMFKAKTAVPAGHTVAVEAVAYDLSGNKHQMTQPV